MSRSKSAKIPVTVENKMKAGIQDCIGELGKFGKTVEGLKKLTIGAGIGTALYKIGEAAKACVENFVDTEDAYLRMAKALGKDDYDKVTRSLNKFSKQTRASKDELVNMMSTMASMGKTTEEMDKITEAAIALSNVTGKDLNSSFEIMLDSLNGSTGEIEKFLPNVKTLTAEEKQLGGAIDLVIRKFGGLSEEVSGKSFGQTVTNIKNSMDSIGESIGAILSLQLGGVFDWIDRRLDEIAQRIKEAKELTESNGNWDEYYTKNKNNILGGYYSTEEGNDKFYEDVKKYNLLPALLDWKEETLRLLDTNTGGNEGYLRQAKALDPLTYILLELIAGVEERIRQDEEWKTRLDNVSKSTAKGFPTAGKFMPQGPTTVDFEGNATVVTPVNPHKPTKADIDDAVDKQHTIDKIAGYILKNSGLLMPKNPTTNEGWVKYYDDIITDTKGILKTAEKGSEQYEQLSLIIQNAEIEKQSYLQQIEDEAKKIKENTANAAENVLNKYDPQKAALAGYQSELDALNKEKESIIADIKKQMEGQSKEAIDAAIAGNLRLKDIEEIILIIMHKMDMAKRSDTMLGKLQNAFDKYDLSQPGNAEAAKQTGQNMILDGLMEAIGPLMEIFDQFFNLIESGCGWLMILIPIIEGFANTVLPMIESVLSPITDFLKLIGSTLGNFFGPIFESLRESVMQIISILADILLPILDMLAPVLDLVASILDILHPILQDVAYVFGLVMIPVNALATTLDYTMNAIIFAVDWAWAQLYNFFHPLHKQKVPDWDDRMGEKEKKLKESWDFEKQEKELRDKLFGEKSRPSNSTETSIQSATYNGAMTVNIYPTVYGPVVGDGGMEQFANMIKEKFEEMEYYGA